LADPAALADAHQPPEAHALAARTKASIHRPLRPGDRGGTGGRGRERGTLSEAVVVATLTVIFVERTTSGQQAWRHETVQVASDGAPVQVKVTVWFHPA
jgi:hypothetical protein